MSVYNVYREMLISFYILFKEKNVFDKFLNTFFKQSNQQTKTELTVSMATKHSQTYEAVA